MRSKTILSTVAFTIAFVFSSAFASLFISKSQTESEFVLTSTHQSTNCFAKRASSETAVRISALINEDKRNGRESNRRAYEISEDVISPFASPVFPDYVISVEEYVDASSSIESNALPINFQTAWREHMSAWRDYSHFLNRMKNPSSRSAWNQAEFVEIESYYNEQINRTWYEVIRIGRNHGADVSH